MRLALVNLSTGDISGGYAEYLNQFLVRAGDDTKISSILLLSVPGIVEKLTLPEKCEPVLLNKWDVLFPSLQKKIVSEIKEFKADITFSPVERTISDLQGIPIVTMVQNMEPLTSFTRENNLAWNLRLVLLRREAISAVRSADHVIALSNFVKDCLVNTIGLNERSITKIPHGFDLIGYQPYTKPVTLKEDQKFIFTAGSVLPARGLDDLIKAYIELTKDNSDSVPKLYIAGKVLRQHNRWFQRLLRTIKLAGVENSIIWLGVLSKNEMAWCYTNTELFVMTSRVESFGIIALESMALGCPVISSTSPCLPEVYGDYADYYEPYNHLELAGKIQQHLYSPIEQKSVSLKLYSWDKIYQTTSSLFQDLIKDVKK
jgi:glycosyltransferase involved in cell wall biosynthesis